MSNAVATISFSEIERLADYVAKSQMFGMKNREQALSLMMISQAEGRHPALAARDYDIIQNRPAKKAEAMLRDFMGSGGKVEWHALDDTQADATFSHPQGGSVRITWDMERVKLAGLASKTGGMYQKYPRQMLRSRCVSEGVRTVCPAATSGFYVPEEVMDFDAGKSAAPPSPPAIAAPEPPTIDVPHDPETGEITPHAIPVPPARQGNGTDWVTWGGQLIAAYKASTTRAELTSWVWENSDALTNCQHNAPKAYASILRAQMTMEKTLPGVEDEPDFIPAAEDAPLTDGI